MSIVWHHFSFVIITSKPALLFSLLSSVTITQNEVKQTTSAWYAALKSNDIRNNTTGGVVISHRFSWPFKHLGAPVVRANYFCQSGPFPIGQFVKNGLWICESELLLHNSELLLVADLLLR